MRVRVVARAAIAGLLIGCSSAVHGEQPQSGQEGNVAARLKKAMNRCQSIPNGSVLRVAETSRKLVCLPTEFYSSKDLKFRDKGASAGYVSNYGGLCQSGFDDKARACWGEGYQIDGWGEVELSVKSGVKSVPNYRIRFIVIDDGPQLTISRFWPGGNTEVFTLLGDGNFSIEGSGTPRKARFGRAVISALQVMLAEETLFGEIQRWQGIRGCPEGTLNFAASYSSPGPQSDPGSGPTFCGGMIPAVLDDLLEWLRPRIQKQLPAYGGYFSEKGARPDRFSSETGN